MTEVTKALKWVNTHGTKNNHQQDYDYHTERLTDCIVAYAKRSSRIALIEKLIGKNVNNKVMDDKDKVFKIKKMKNNVIEEKSLPEVL